MSFSIKNQNSRNNIIFIGEHTSKKFPKENKQLGLKKEVLGKLSNYYDKGAKDILLILSKELNAAAVYANYSRLLIDLNRNDLKSKELIREIDNKIIIPGNQNISKKERRKRIKLYWKPYYKELKKQINKRLKFDTIYAFSVHSCFPKLNGKKRNFDIDLLFNKDELLAKKIGKVLSKKGYDIKYNHPPFSGKRKKSLLNFKNKKLKWIFFEINHKILSSNKKIKKVSKDIKEAIIKSLK
jgi:predicted N-formylglutamate amidohydrolase